MSKRRKILLVLVAGVMALMAFVLIQWQHGSNELAARQKLDNMLGQGSDNSPDAGSEQGNDPFSLDAEPGLPSGPPIANAPNPQSQGFLGLPIPNPMANMPDSGVNVQESAAAYTLRVPLTNPADARNVKVNVTPHHIEVSGKVGRQEQGVAFTSSFMQSFSTSQTVLPDKVTQKTEKVGDKTELVITVPKKQSSQPNLQAPPAPAAPTAPKPPEEILQDDEGVPSSDGEHHVI